MESPLTENDWDLLIDRIGTGRCTPFLGAGVAAGLLPLGRAVAKELATQYDYPFDNVNDLVNVSQYVAIRYDSIYPKERLAKSLQSARLPESAAEPDGPHRLLAKLPVPLYITTNYERLHVAGASESQGQRPAKGFLPLEQFHPRRASITV